MELLLKGVADGRGGLLAPEMLFQELGGFGRPNERFRFGIRMEKVTPVAAEQLGLEAGRGIAVTNVIPGSAAEKAGIKPNDIILEFAGKPVSDSPEEFNQKVTAAKAGEKIDAVVLRKGKKVEIKGIVLPESDREAPRANRRLQPRLELPPGFPNALPDLGPKPGGSGLSVTLGKGNFTIQSIQDGTKYDLSGTTEDGTVKLAEITIEVDGKATKYESVDKVPEEHKATVEKLLKTIGGKPEIRLRPRVKD
jgi:membrane-associated protease RseP (regulator of RpoE activity)